MLLHTQTDDCAKAETDPITGRIAGTHRLLWMPGGRRPCFASSAAIVEHRAAFTEACHATWKAPHNRSRNEILIRAGLLSPDRRKRMLADLIWFLSAPGGCICNALGRR